MNDRLEHAINHADRFDKCVAAIFCDLDNFKPINDTYGHSTGDEILKNVANAMKDLLRKEDTICRFGGDEFVILVEELESFTYLEKILEKIRYISTKPFNIEGVDHSVGMSIGTAIYPNDANSAEDLLKCADEAMYRAKKSGKNKIEFFQSNPLIYANNRAFLNNLN
jgi:diguanylate cyclase (GGDEF)-like protein